MPTFEKFVNKKTIKKKNPISYDISPYGISFPSAANLNEDQVNYVCDIFIKFLDLKIKTFNKNKTESNSDITIIIPTFNRYGYLLRLLRFYDRYDHDFKFIIADSSSSNFDIKLKPFINRKNFIYHKFNSNIFFISKISKILESLNTEFAVLCADDDFLIPNGIVESKNFLKSNQDYSSAHGLYFNHTSFIDTNGYNKSFRIGPIHSNAKSSSENSPKERVRRYLFGYENRIYPLYAVHRSDIFKLIWKDADNVVSDWGLSEHYPSCLSLIYGKMKILNCFYSSREPNTFAFQDPDSYKRMYSDKN